MAYLALFLFLRHNFSLKEFTFGYHLIIFLTMTFFHRRYNKRYFEKGYSVCLFCFLFTIKVNVCHCCFSSLLLVSVKQLKKHDILVSKLLFEMNFGQTIHLFDPCIPLFMFKRKLASPFLA